MAIIVRMQFWNCPVCRKTRIPASTKICPNEFCKEPFNPTVHPELEYYTAEDSPVLDPSDPAVSEWLASGGEYYCDHCGVPFAANKTKCAHCGDGLSTGDVRSQHVTYDDNAPRFDLAPTSFTETDDERNLRIIEKGAGNPRIMPKRVLPTSLRRLGGRTTAEYDASNRAADERFEQSMELKRLSPFARTLRSIPRATWIGVGAMVTVVIMVLFVVVVNHFSSIRDGTVTVTGLRWERSIDIERYQTVQRGDWHIPPGGRRVSTHDKQDGERKVYVETIDVTQTSTITETTTIPTTYKCSTFETTGDGLEKENEQWCPTTKNEYNDRKETYVTESEVWTKEPIMRPWHTYLIDVWDYDRQVQSSDDKSVPMYWPEIGSTYSNNFPGTQLGEERTGSRYEYYLIDFVDEYGEQRTDRGRTDSVWQRLDVGDAVEAKYREHNDAFVSVDWNSVVQSVS